ncbi:hypothetical protein K2X92_00200 [Candidatus Gracilibacteria bacterium]|nr:hypothetical protein [Candidatus Gracilibacteria bacterium]
MQRFFLPIVGFSIALLSLQSCGSKQDTLDTPLSTPVVQKVNTEIGENISETSTGSVQSSTVSGAVSSSGASKGVQEIITLQKEKGPAAILDANCTKLDKDGKLFCEKQKKMMEDIAENNITWENTLKRGPEYIKTFDCKKIFSEYGQKYCTEYKALLK